MHSFTLALAASLATLVASHDQSQPECIYTSTATEHVTITDIYRPVHTVTVTDYAQHYSPPDQTVTVTVTETQIQTVRSGITYTDTVYQHATTGTDGGVVTVTETNQHNNPYASPTTISEPPYTAPHVPYTSKGQVHVYANSSSTVIQGTGTGYVRPSGYVSQPGHAHYVSPTGGYISHTQNTPPAGTTTSTPAHGTGYSSSPSYSVPSGTGYSPSSIHTVPHGTGYSSSSIYTAPSGTGYSPSSTHTVPHGTGYSSSSIYTVPIGTGYSSSSIYTVPSGTGYSSSSIYTVPGGTGYSTSSIYTVPTGTAYSSSTSAYVTPVSSSSYPVGTSSSATEAPSSTSAEYIPIPTGYYYKIKGRAFRA